MIRVMDPDRWGIRHFQLWCDRCGRRLAKGTPLALTADRWHDPIEGRDRRSAVCPECAEAMMADSAADRERND